MRISQKEKMQLGYSRSPHSPSRDSNPSPRRSPDIDFSDVFGGPPRRASMQDMQTRYSSSDDGDGDGSDERLSRSSWSNNPIEKPVFGDEITTRRRYPSEDFFGDIFRGDQSQCSSPRITGRDPNSSLPGSRGLTPLPPGAVPLGSPAQFSLPARISNSHSSSTSRLSGQGVHNDVFQGGDAFSAYRRSPLAGEEPKKDGNSDGSGGGTQVPNGGNQFHFSIHKWASKGMPLVMSLGKRSSLRSKIQLERSLSLNDGVEVESDTLVGEIQPAGVDNDECLSFKVHVVSSANKESDQIVNKSVTEAPNNKVEDGNSASKEMKVMPEPDIDPKSDPKQSSNKSHGLEGRSDFDKNEGGEEVRKSKGENKTSNDNYPKSLGKDKPKEKMKESKLNDRVGEKGKGDKGKVKEFVKIFNQEPSLKPNADIVGKSPSSRRRNTEESRASSKSTLSSSKTDGKVQGSDVNCRLDSSPKVDGNPTPSSGKQFEPKKVPEPCRSSSIETENLESTMGSASGGLRASRASIDVTFESFVVEEIQESQDKPSENSEDNEDIRAYESKILKWSKGKEGNIRALLSTLQYVLWPNSGWKPVPLVNIIEANAVKRSYQRALLYLHPDKLQQKGAAAHQKFIAAKVFDILQEAWDHFNTLGSL